jgi:hypothetical protein
MLIGCPSVHYSRHMGAQQQRVRGAGGSAVFVVRLWLCRLAASTSVIAALSMQQADLAVCKLSLADLLPFCRAARQQRVCGTGGGAEAVLRVPPGGLARGHGAAAGVCFARCACVRARAEARALDSMVHG